MRLHELAQALELKELTPRTARRPTRVTSTSLEATRPTC